jgi:hypothetical protein
VRSATRTTDEPFCAIANLWVSTEMLVTPSTSKWNGGTLWTNAEGRNGGYCMSVYSDAKQTCTADILRPSCHRMPVSTQYHLCRERASPVRIAAADGMVLERG